MSVEEPRPGGISWNWTACVLVLALVAVLALPFLLRRPPEVQVGTDDGPPPASGRELVIISPHWDGIRDEFESAFSAHTWSRFGHLTDIEWLDVGGTSDAIRYVRSEFSRSPEGIDIDLFFGGGVDPYLQLGQERLLSPCSLPEDILGAIPRKLAGINVYDADGRWFGACLSGFGIVYNKKVLEILDLKEPTDWSDLARPEYLTWVGSGDPRSSGSVHMAYEIIAQAYGWQEGWANIVRMGGNIRSFSRSAGQVPKDTALGEVACAMAIDLYAWKKVAEVGPDRMGFVLPEGVTVVNPDGIAVLKGAPNRDLAEEFIAFVLSEAGQRLWALKVGAPGGPKEFELFRMSVIPGFAAGFGDQAAVAFDPYTWKGGFTYDSEMGSLRWGILNDLIGATIIDTHRELVVAWRVVKDLPPDDPRALELVRAPMPEAELLRIAREEWSDAEFRARMKARWAAEAGQRYRRIARGE